ncbi:hypothetical protein EV646_116105 [Kribbella antiqua]|uniref:Uncharacterized protein n=1 Tax=Kribbella antiqua TaxID=2512217 RepID=A0A4R2I9C8_9ACTN|nr:hypothetical protein [Kribbella antiqua]TCO41014.1 hypothetical protein EV646_116105 [Kribbella antiqua]
MTFALVGGLVVGAFFGAGMTYSLNRQRRSERRALGNVRQQDWKAARRAAARGAVPADPAVRAAAARLAVDQLSSLRRRRKLIVIVFGVNLVIAVVNLFVNPSLWCAVLAICWTLGVAGQWYLQRRLRHRVNLLTDDTHDG